MSKALAIAAAAALAGNFGASVSAGQPTGLDRTVSLQSDGTVSIRTHKGSVKIETWDRPQAEVSARIEPDTSCGDDADQQERVRRTRIDFEASPGRLELHSNYDDLKDLEPIRMRIPGLDGAVCSAYPFVHYRLRIPATARLDVQDHKSKIDADGLRGPTRINSHKGHVDVKDQVGGLDLETHKGDVRVEFESFKADSRLITHKGDIDVSLPRGAGFDLDASLERGGELDSEFPIAERTVDRRSRSFEQAVNGGGPLLELRTHKGTLRLREK